MPRSPSSSSSLRSPSRRPSPSPGPSPIEVFLGCFFSRGVFELPVVELVAAYLVAFRGDSVQQAWLSLWVVAAWRKIELLPGPVDIGDHPFCPKTPDGSAFLATARLLIPLDEARELAAVAASTAPLARCSSPSREDRATAQQPPDVSTGVCPRATVQKMRRRVGASPDHGRDQAPLRVGAGGCSAAVRSAADRVTEDERDFCPMALSIAA